MVAVTDSSSRTDNLSSVENLPLEGEQEGGEKVSAKNLQEFTRLTVDHLPVRGKPGGFDEPLSTNFSCSRSRMVYTIDILGRVTRGGEE